MIEEFIIQMEPKLQVERGDLESSDSDIRQDFLTLKFNEIFRKPQYADIIKDAESRIPDSTIL
ncbi:MAG: hypothetical protein H6767_09600 [Candidatus Peribacteria bacterium]|nr:MAG: hypothetical protein H6767_09600 [Candidatus Peribacteria bacterium]